MRKREIRERFLTLEVAVAHLNDADSRADFYRQTLEMTLQSQQRDINRILDRLSPPELDAKTPGPMPGPEPNRKPDPRLPTAGDADKLIFLHAAKLTRQLAIARDALALYADEKYWEGDRCPMLRNAAAAHALGEMAAVDVSGSTAGVSGHE